MTAEQPAARLALQLAAADDELRTVADLAEQAVAIMAHAAWSVREQNGPLARALDVKGRLLQAAVDSERVDRSRRKRAEVLREYRDSVPVQ